MSLIAVGRAFMIYMLDFQCNKFMIAVNMGRAKDGA